VRGWVQDVGPSPYAGHLCCDEIGSRAIASPSVLCSKLRRTDVVIAAQWRYAARPHGDIISRDGRPRNADDDTESTTGLYQQ
jgi:hypothetical protein